MNACLRTLDLRLERASESTDRVRRQLHIVADPLRMAASRALSIPHILDGVLDALDSSMPSTMSFFQPNPYVFKDEVERVRILRHGLRAAALVCRAWRPIAQAALFRVLLFEARGTTRSRS